MTGFLVYDSFSHIYGRINTLTGLRKNKTTTVDLNKIKKIMSMDVMKFIVYNTRHKSRKYKLYNLKSPHLPTRSKTGLRDCTMYKVESNQYFFNDTILYVWCFKW